MKLILNEQEVIDGCCVYCDDDDPESVVVDDLSFDQRHGFRAVARRSFRKFNLDEEDIKEGIARFLQGYHSFNPDDFLVKLNFTDDVGIWAEVLVNESP